MAKGSQLSQLKSSLSKAGFTGQQNNSGNKRKRTAVSTEKDKDRKAARLEEINRKLNPFDVKVTNLKHETGGRKLKGVSGKPSISKQEGLDSRKQALLKDRESKNRAGGIVDRRFGENDANMTVEERMLERFTREKQRSSKNFAYNLEDEEELTHYGQSLSRLDDFDGAELGLSEDDEDPEGRSGQLDRSVVRNTHFSGFDDEDEGDEEDEDGEPARKKSKAEVMAEVIAKSKGHKMLRQMERDKEDNLRHELDNDFDAIKALLHAPDPASGTNTVRLGYERPRGTAEDQYDANVRELAFEKRAQPKDRTKTEEEVALEEKEALETAERRRMRRMHGDDEESGDDDSGKPRKRKRERGADDLDDDWDDLGAGLGAETMEEDGEELSMGEESEAEASDDSGSDSEEAGDARSDIEEDEPRSTKSAASTNGRSGKRKQDSLPFTFQCPETHDDFLEILEGVDSSDVPTVIQRIRTLYHPSLGLDNKTKLQRFCNVLIDHTLHLGSSSEPSLDLVSSMVPHLSSLVRAFPAASAQHCMQKMNIFYKNLKRGLSGGGLDLESRTFPGIAELSFLRLMGFIWSTSDMNHAVISPARVLMGSYLGLCRVRSVKDLASGLFLCTVLLQYESVSKRFVPEAINFLVNAVVHLAPHSYASIASVPGSAAIPDFDSDLCQSLKINPARISKKEQKTERPRQINITSILSRAGDDADEADKLDLLTVAFSLLGRYADFYKGLDGFIEIFEPISQIITSFEVDIVSLRTQQTALQSALQRLVQFARQSRQPLLLQAHKPIAIPSYIPKFESSSSSYLRRQDPDHERNEASKLRHQYKQEKKGAIRELRKDARFLAGVQQQEIREKDQAYNKRMKRVHGELESDRADEKRDEREKSRDKRRAGRK
ncbi:nucleolar protein 14 [Pterulicium gracile]|uniref:Nucleolar protein 14 n=1 Tax=Pterulicium gracile TaxID=1884261 RepID=A0A5C3QVF8_9AGAR|nr:nucleolar protein 14 [Pterula gracilis]